MMEQITSSVEKIVNSFLHKLATQDADGIAKHFAEKIDWYVPGDQALPWVGFRSNRLEVAQYFLTMWPHFVPGKSTAKLEKVLITGQDVVVLATFSHTVVSTGKSFQTPVAMHLIVTNDKIVKMCLYEDTWTVSRAFSK